MRTSSEIVLSSPKIVRTSSKIVRTSSEIVSGEGFFGLEIGGKFNEPHQNLCLIFCHLFRILEHEFVKMNKWLKLLKRKRFTVLPTLTSSKIVCSKLSYYTLITTLSSSKIVLQMLSLNGAPCIVPVDKPVYNFFRS